MSGWRETLATTPMRLTLRLVALFLAVSLAGFGMTWWLSRAAILEAAETALDQQIYEISTEGDAEAVAQAVAEAASRADHDHLILRYDGPGGMVGNYTGPLPPGETIVAALRDRARDIDGLYILRRKQVAGGELTVGQDADAIDELAEVFLQVLFFTLLPTLVLVLGGGLALARRSARRLAAIEATMTRLAAGDLAARLPAIPGPADDLSRLGAGIDRLAEAHEASIDALRQVSADIAHDLKTPIQRLELLLDEARREAPGLAVLDRAGAEIEGIVATFQALLRIAQLEGAGARTRFSPVDLGAVARTMVEVYEPAAEESGHTLSLTLDHPAVIPGDRTLLAQVLANLIENALRHAPPGPVSVAVRGAELCVADRGPGIPEAEREAVLRRLYRLDRSRSTPGNGLGLALVDAIVRLHDGRIELADNAPGLWVLIRLPEVTDR